MGIMARRKIAPLMPQYEYRCTECQSETTITTSVANYSATFAGKPLACEACMGGELRRFYRPLPFTLPMADHFNVSAGQHVSGERELTEVFKRKSEEATERLGIEHNFKPIDLRDHEALGVTREGLEEDVARRHDAGLPSLPIPK